MPTTLTQDEIATYESQGYLAPRPGLTAAEAARWRAEVEAFGRRHELREALVLRNKAHLKMPALGEIVTDARILDQVEGILGPDILCWGSSLFIKEPGGPETVAWHQDSYYWDMTPDDVCVVWLALIESTPSQRGDAGAPGQPSRHRAGAPGLARGQHQHAVHLRGGRDRGARGGGARLRPGAGRAVAAPHGDPARLGCEPVGRPPHGLFDHLCRTACASWRQAQQRAPGPRPRPLRPFRPGPGSQRRDGAGDLRLRRCAVRRRPAGRGPSGATGTGFLPQHGRRPPLRDSGRARRSSIPPPAGRNCRPARRWRTPGRRRAGGSGTPSRR